MIEYLEVNGNLNFSSTIIIKGLKKLGITKAMQPFWSNYSHKIKFIIMRISILISSLFFFISFFAQNLVPNPSFEINTGCPIGPGEITNVTGWSNPDTATADYFHSCNTGVFPLPAMSVPSNIMGYQQARTGNGYAGIICNEVINFPPLPAIVDDYREYIQIQLTSPLQAGEEYEVKFHWSLSNASTHYIEELGVYFSNSLTFLQQSTALNLTPQVTVSGTPLNDTTNWVAFSQTFTATGGEQYLIIGNFNDPTNTTSGATGVTSSITTGGDHAYYYIDDVSVQKTTCFEIEKILVDACDSHTQATPDEGKNEMVTFRIGNQDLNATNLTVSWPSNSWQGLVQDAVTAQLVSDINATITGCGYLLEPVGGILPAGKEVLLITSYNFNPTLHSFANLNDTLIVLVQDANTGAGHFANYNSSGGNRTLSMSFSTPNGCSDVVTYQRDLLVNQLGAYGGNSLLKDGAFVSFTAGGIATYDNIGCQLPTGILSIDINGDLSTVCGGETINLEATINGLYNEIIWSSSEGTFSQNNTATTVMTVSNTVSNSFYIYGGVVSNCTDTIMDSIQITIGSIPNVSVQVSNDTICSGQSVTITASGGSSYTWNNGSTANPLTVTTGGNYTVVANSSCGIDSATVFIYEMAAPLPIIVPSPLVSCDSNELHTQDLSNIACEGCSYLWSDGSTGPTYSGTTTNYSVTVQNYCGSITANYNIQVFDVDANIFVQDSIGDAPFSVPFSTTSVGGFYVWNFDNGNTSTTVNPTEVFTQPGTYNVSLTVTNQSCTATAYQTIIVNASEEPSLYTEVIIPNIFTPNGDNENDHFLIHTVNAKDLTGTIYNRWGNELHNLNGLDATWDGGTANDGTYFYILEVTFLDDTKKEYSGSFMLIR